MRKDNGEIADTPRYTVVVSSCDKYEDLWDPFFKVLQAEWPQLGQEQIPVVLNTEHKTYEYDGLNIRTMQFYGEDDNPSWTKRLRRTLETIETEYIIFLLDDFYMQDKVRSDRIDQCIRWMDDNRRISMFCFKETYASANINDGKYKGFERRPLFGKYKFNCQAALWRRDRLICYLKKDENPWEWEVYGNWRSYRLPYHLFYSLVPGEEKVFVYTHEIKGQIYGGSGVYRGKWFVPSVDPIFKKHGIEIDYSIRGTVSEDEIGGRITEKSSCKRKEDAPKWKQRVWFARPVYCAIERAFKQAKYILANIDHFI